MDSDEYFRIRCSRLFNFALIFPLFAPHTHVLRTTLRIYDELSLRHRSARFGRRRYRASSLPTARRHISMCPLCFSMWNFRRIMPWWALKVESNDSQMKRDEYFSVLRLNFPLIFSLFALFSGHTHVVHSLRIRPRTSASFGSLRAASARISCYKVPSKYFSCFRESNFQRITPRWGLKVESNDSLMDTDEYFSDSSDRWFDFAPIFSLFAFFPAQQCTSSNPSAKLSLGIVRLASGGPDIALGSARVSCYKIPRKYISLVFEHRIFGKLCRTTQSRD